MPSRQPFAPRLLPAVLCLFVMLLATCGPSSDTTNHTLSSPIKASAEKQILIAPLAGISDIKTLDPGLSTDPASIKVIDMLFTGLVQLNDQLQVVPQLAR